MSSKGEGPFLVRYVILLLLPLSAGVLIGTGNYTLFIAFLLLILCIFVVSLILYSPVLAFLAAVASLPLQSVAINVGVNVPPIFLFLSIMLALFLVGKVRLRRTPLDLAVLVFLGTGLLSLSVGLIIPPPLAFIPRTYGMRGSSLRGLFQFLERNSLFLMMYATVSFCTNWVSIRRALKIFLIVTAIVVSYGIYQYFAQLLGLPLQDVGTALNTDLSVGSAFRADFPLPRVRSTFLEPLYFGNYLISVICLSMSLLLCNSCTVVDRRLLYLVLYISFPALLLTFSRGAWVSFGVSLALLVAGLLWIDKQRVKALWKWIVVITFVMMLALALGAETHILDTSIVTQRIQSMNSSYRGYWSQHVVTPWKIMVDSGHILWGVGLGNYYFYEAHFLERPGYGTTMWMYTLFEMGLPGLVALVGIIVQIFLASFRALSRLSLQGQMILVGIVSGFAGTLFHSVIYTVPWDCTDWFLLGVLFSIVRIELGEGNAQDRH